MFQLSRPAAPQLQLTATLRSGRTDDTCEYYAATVRSMLPVILKTGVATAEEIDIDTLADRLRADTLSCGAIVKLLDLVGAWARNRPDLGPRGPGQAGRCRSDVLWPGCGIRSSRQVGKGTFTLRTGSVPSASHSPSHGPPAADPTKPRPADLSSSWSFRGQETCAGLDLIVRRLRW